MSDYSRGDALQSIIEASKILGETPSMRQYEELGLSPSRATICEYWNWQELKEEAGLETLDAGDRSGSDIEAKPDDVEIPEGESWSSLSPHMRWYYKNQEEAIEKSRQRNNKLRNEYSNFISEIKTNRGCNVCGFDEHPEALDFHHIDEEEKSMTVSQMISKGYGRESLLEEIQKCTVLCANCHRVEHSS